MDHKNVFLYVPEMNTPRVPHQIGRSQFSPTNSDSNQYISTDLQKISKMNRSATLAQKIQMESFRGSLLQARFFHPGFFTVDDNSVRAERNNLMDDEDSFTITSKDVSHESTSGNQQTASSGASIRETFPVKVYQMLQDAEREGFDSIVRWQPDGLSFGVYKKKEFVERVMPRYFKQTRYRSFQRQVRS